MQLVTILVYVPSSDAAWCFLSVNVVEKTDSTVALNKYLLRLSEIEEFQMVFRPSRTHQDTLMALICAISSLKVGNLRIH